VKREEMIDLSSDPVLATARNTGKKQNVVEIDWSMRKMGQEEIEAFVQAR
jgi:hypothetical protein